MGTVIMKILYLCLAGAAGTLARYGLAGFVQARMGSSFPWGTVAVNLLGCFLVGLLWHLAESRITLQPEVRVAIFVGFMGAFTTFSTYMLETHALLRDAEWGYALGNLAVQNVLGIAAVVLGIAVARVI